MKRFIKINSEDNVILALDDIIKGEDVCVDNKKFSIKQDILSGHKFSLCDIAKGENIIKYGSAIGHALQDIKCGEWVHTHNLKTNLCDDLNYTYTPSPSSLVAQNNQLKFKGYLRKNGDVGVRNEFWIVPSVGCVNGQAEAIIRRIKSECDIQHLDDVRVYTHNYGCSQLGDDHENTKNALAQLIKHPNAGAVFVLGLGCENNQIPSLIEALGDYNQDRIDFLIAQDVEDEIEVGFEKCCVLLEKTRQDSRTLQDISALKIGLKCGGSDGFSGITANPLVGLFSDWLIERGGSTILTEVPEMFGAETILMSRAKNKEVFDNIVALINNFKEYFRSHNQPIYENPSPGNKKGGITTLEEKSLGCTQKGGSAEVVDVLKYGEALRTKGLNLLSAPGNDLVAASSLALSGCQIVLFTTGRGTPFGSFVPTMKISTNTALYKFKSNWIDFNAGVLLEDKSWDCVLKDFIDFILETASGKHLNHEKTGFKEIAIFKTGVTL